MAITEARGTNSVIRSTPGGSGLYDVLELILDKGLVIDAYVRVSLVGIELLTIDARVVVASVDTYLRFAEAVDRLDIRGQSDEETTNMKDITDGIGGGAKALGMKKTAGSLMDRVESFFGSDDDDEDGGGSSLLDKITDFFSDGDDDDEESDDGDASDDGERRKRQAVKTTSREKPSNGGRSQSRQRSSAGGRSSSSGERRSRSSAGNGNGRS